MSAQGVDDPDPTVAQPAVAQPPVEELKARIAAGPRTFINRRKIAMKAAICAGDHIIGTATVTRVYRHESGHGRVDLDVWIRNQDGADCCVADATVTLPSRAQGAG